MQHVSSVVDEGVAAVAATGVSAGGGSVRSTAWNANLEWSLSTSFEFVETLLGKLDAALWELNTWILVYKLFV